MSHEQDMSEDDPMDVVARINAEIAAKISARIAKGRAEFNRLTPTQQANWRSSPQRLRNLRAINALHLMRDADMERAMERERREYVPPPQRDPAIGWIFNAIGAAGYALLFGGGTMFLAWLFSY
jgi:hypothetical protein